MVWFRRDLRLADHPALAAACVRGAVVPLFVVDPRLVGRAAARDAWLWATLAALDESLQRAGSRLVVRHGDPRAEIARAAREAGADAVHYGRDWTPFARARDAAVERACAAAGVEARAFPGESVVEPDAVTTASGSPYTVFTPYFRAWSVCPRPVMLEAPSRVLTPRSPPSDALPRRRSPAERAGEAAARVALERFLAGPLAAYATDRDRLDLAVTSGLSLHLRFGAISARRLRAAVAEAAARDGRLAAGAAAFVRQLAWRDFFTQVLWHHPRTRREPLRREREPAAWPGEEDSLAAWREGRTGYPLVDAAMRQLAETGWLPNRARMVAASFLVKHLLVDWRAGERWFMQRLVDGDPAQNGGNWQWVASLGADALPAFRIFNPVTQGRRFDPDGRYVRRWVREIVGVDTAHVHAPWEAGGVPGYPRPIVDHRAARLRALRAFRRGS